MKVLLVRGNPRKSGFTQYLVDLFASGLRDAGAQVTDVDLTTESHALKPCLGCYHCWLIKPGECIHHDPMEELLPALLAADVLVCATPVYYFAMSSQLKNFFERTFPLTAEGLERSRMGMLRNRLREPAKWAGKKLISITVGALRAREAYEPINQTFRLIADTLDMQLGGQLTRTESHLLPYRLSKPITLKRVESAFVRAGREAATTGTLSAKTMASAELPLSPDEDCFRTYGNIYWEHAASMGATKTNSTGLQQQVGSDPDILMREMARGIDPKTTARLRAVLQFDFPDRQRHYRLTVNKGRCELKFEPTVAPDLRVTCALDIWVALFTRQLNVAAALRQGVITLEGDKSLFTKLDRYFPPPAV
ncbi:MAG TPA: NAD(P)H-dependent oxidoreductase [Verrucomicrobiae bacterium]|nr:NAD(P)H-dependent oxidoreductase [Verrucomicrobiae bacterium]